MKSETYKVKGMHCASCSAIIEKTLKKVEGVHSVEVNYGTEVARISFDETKTNPEHLSEKIKPLGYSFEMPSAESMGMTESEHAGHLGLNQSKTDPSISLRASKLAEIADMRAKVFSAVPLAVFSVFVMSWEISAQFGILPAVPYVWKEFFHHLLPLMATYILFVVGKPYL